MYTAYNKQLNFHIVMDSYAVNGGNGAINTAGKGTNRLMFNSAKIAFDM
ncbi:hypothetical protein [Spiroplasma clarkii]|nr:hypothetical protein [Spiroplasma clarkii]